MSKILSSLVFWALIPGTAIAQITPDSSLGEKEKSVVNTNGNRDTINGGAVREANLFHSFQEFNVGAGREAYFNNPNGINNIFSRVTGSNISDIQGVLGVLGNANLYLINPNGILFGENARLDVNGSFFATTADSVLFGNGLEFSAANPNQPPLLTIDIPLGLKFRDNPADITVRGNGNGVRLLDSEVIDTQEALRVDSNATIGLVGGNLIFEDATIKTAGGRIELGSVAGGKVHLVEIADVFTFDYSGVEIFRDISLSGTNSIDASGLGGGDIQVAGNNISISGISAIVSHTLGSIPGGDINVLATESLEINGVENDFGLASGIANRVYPNATAVSGDINIETGSLRLNNRAFIRTSTLGEGSAGNITINARDFVSIASQESRSEIASNVTFGAVGNGGDITITTPSLTLGDGVSINAGTSGQGNGGNITINASESISLVSQGNFTDISSSTVSGAVGDAGNILVNTRLLTLTNRAFFDVSAFGGQGNAGNVTLNASEAAHFDRQDTFGANGIFTYVVLGSIGNAGNIEINTGSLALDNGTRFFANNSSQGNGGNITINARNLVSLDNQRTGFLTDVSSRNLNGDAGNIEINTSSLTLDNGATLSGDTEGRGNAGNVIINATENVALNNSSSIDVTSINFTGLEGNAGNIELNTGSLTLDDGARLAANTRFTETAKGGNITINATDDVTLNNSSVILVSGSEGGSINLRAKNLTVTSESILVGGIAPDLSFVEAQSGDIVINLTEDLVLDGLDGENFTLIGNSNFGIGNAGNIYIKARNIDFKNGANVVSFNSGEGDIGKIQLTATGNVTFDGIKGDRFSGIDNFVAPGATGDVGEIDITAQNLTLTNGARIISTVGGTANSGNINLNIADTINIDGFGLSEIENIPEEFSSGILSTVATGIGNSGNINIKTQNLSLTRTGFISASNEGKGDSGNITINVTEGFVARDNSLIISNIGNVEEIAAIGKVGNISITAKEISFAEASKIEAGAFSGATATQLGTISLTATESISLAGTNTGIDARNEFRSFGDASNILLSTGNLTLTNGAQITNSNSGEGNSGDIRIDTNNLTLNNETQIGNVILGQGNAGNITINATDTVFLEQNSALISSVGKEALGNGGGIQIDTSNLTLTNGAQIQNALFGKGNTGDITINATNAILLGQNSAIDSSVQSRATGNAGKVRIDTKNLTLTNGAQILSDTFGKGNAGSVTINATDTIFLDGENRNGRISIIGSSIQKEAIGNAGEVTIDTKNLTLTNGAQINSGTFGEGDGNTIKINATDTISLDGTDKKGIGSAISTSVQPEAIGNAGKVDINSQNLFLTNGAFISSSTLGEGDAGSVIVSVSDSIKLSGISSNGRGGLFVLATESIGNGGDLSVFTNELIVSDGASISASNLPSIEGLREPGTGKAGSVRIEANKLTLENGGRINAATQAGNDGNISLKVAEDIIFRDNSLISAQALKDATGGNIDIDTRFIVAFPNQNNDIIASAERGQGGKINITTEGIFGLEERSSTPPNNTNDIDASSEFGLSGEVNIIQPTVNPASGLVDLTQEIVDPAKLIAQNVCTQTANSKFVDIGKGGLPKNPEEVLTEDTIEVGLIAPIISSSETTEPATEREEVKPKKTRKPPAQGWIWHENGIVELVAYNPDQVGEQRTRKNHRGCQN